MVVWIISVLLILYTLFTLLLILAWLRIPYFTAQNKTQVKEKNIPVKIAVIIPVRNEGENIISLLEDLNLQTYNSQSFEVIVTDDNSSDNTFALVKDFKLKAKYFLQIIALPQEKEMLSPKKSAITLAQQHTTAELIVTTDGDCRVKPDWLSLIARFYLQKEAKFISGGVGFFEEKNLFEKIQSIEFAALIASGAACINLGYPSMCNGANMAYPKKVFEEVQGYAGVEHLASGDDEFLMHKIARIYPDKIFFLKNKNTLVTTKAKKNLYEFYQQRKRWASKWKYYQSSYIKLLAFFIFLCNFGLILALGLVLGALYSTKLFLIQVGLKFGIEFIFLSLILVFLDKKKLILLIPFVQLFYAFYVLIFGVIANFGRYEWKGRKF